MWCESLIENKQFSEILKLHEDGALEVGQNKISLNENSFFLFCMESTSKSPYVDSSLGFETKTLYFNSLPHIAYFLSALL